MRDSAGTVAEDLDLDVAGARDELLNVEIAPAKRGLRLGLTALIGGVDRPSVQHRACAASAAAGHRLDDHRAAVQRGEERVRLVQRNRAVEAANHRHIHGRRGGAGTRLVAEQFEMRDVGTNEGQPGLGAASAKVRTFGQEAVTGMDGVTLRRLCRRNHVRAVQIGRGPLAWQRQSLIGHAQMQRARVVLGIDRHRREAHVGCRAGDADGDLTAIGDQQFRNGHLWVPEALVAENSIQRAGRAPVLRSRRFDAIGGSVIAGRESVIASVAKQSPGGYARPSREIASLRSQCQSRATTTIAVTNF